ncbi:hypothetical protein TKK_0002386, partial [Trichogramma kaykai]
MGNSATKVEAQVEAKSVTEKKPLKPCCACPETRIRDE